MKDYQVVWRGLVHDNTGYSQVSRHSILELDKLGIDVKVEPFDNGAERAQLPADEEAKLNELIEKPLGNNTIQVIHLQPNAYITDSEDQARYGKRIGFTVWETDKLPVEWVPWCNTMDAIIVPSQFNKDVFKASGVTVPIYVARHGIETTKFHKTDERIDFSEQLPPSVFLSVCSWQHRKGLDVLLEAFFREFTAKDDVALVLKTSGFQSTSDVHRIIKQYKDNLGLKYNTAPVYVSSENFSAEEMNKLYNSATCYVLPSRGEGVGLPYLEAMACGLPCIAPKWGGQTDFLNKQNSFLLNGELKPVNEQMAQFVWFKSYMKWFEADRRHLATLMREVYRNPKEAERKGKKAYETVISEWTWENTVHDLVKIFDEVIK